MKIPFKYVRRNFVARRLTTAITIAGISLVVFVFSAVLMMAYGVQKTLIATGSDDNVLVARKAANGEISSIIPSETANIIKSLPQIARAPDDSPIASGEVVVVINLPKISEGGISNVTVRGVSPPAFQLRPQVKIVAGRMFAWGAREVIVGSAVAKRIEGAQIGKEVKFVGNQWRIVGMFETGGSGFDSEMWGDVAQIHDAFRRSGSFSTLTFRLQRRDQFDPLRAEFERDNRLQEFEPKIEKRFFEEQSELLATFIRILGIFVTLIFSAGATIGAMITMYAAVANRTAEVGTLRALGFRRRSVLGAFLVESLLIAVTGGAIGLFLASTLQFFRVSTLNFGSFSELEFAFALSPQIVIASLAFAMLMGVLGGFLPSVRASRLNIVNALRSS
jgi:ABC-type lipoprotein release transport system permease subunit